MMFDGVVLPGLEPGVVLGGGGGEGVLGEGRVGLGVLGNRSTGSGIHNDPAKDSEYTQY